MYIVSFFQNIYLILTILVVLAHLVESPCELSPSLGVCRPLTFQI